MKIAVVFDTLHPDWEDADYKKEVDAKVEEAEYDVARALLAQGHDLLMVGVAEHLAPDVPVIVVTGQPSPEVARTVREAGAVLLPKPVTSGELRAAIERVLAG